MTRYEFSLPDPGEGLTEAEIVEWHAATGEVVAEDDPLLDVETDKAVVEIPVPCDGTLEERRAEPGEVVSVGEIVAVFETSHPPQREQEGGTATAEASSGAHASTADASSDERGRVFAAPSTRRYAREIGVDLATIEGTGPGGRVLRSDVDTHAETESSNQAATTPDTLSPSAPAQSQAHVTAEGDRETRRPLRGLRRAIADNMKRSKSEIPHVTSGFRADAGEFVHLRERLNEAYDVRVSYTAMVVKAVVPALKEFPIVNARIDEDTEEIVEKHYYDIGVATHTEDGLLVPVVRDVDSKSLVEVSEELERLADEARDRSIAPEDLSGSTFTVTNVGSHSENGTFGTPIINHPEAAILGLGRIREEPVAVGDDVEVREQLHLSLSYDHRLVDGVTAAEFGDHVVESIEDPDILLSRL